MESAIVGDKGSTTLGKNGNTKLENNYLCRCQDYSMIDGLYDNTRIAKGGTPLPHTLPRVRKHERIHHHINSGSVSCYFYDAAGERTVKLTSESEMVHVNGKKVGGNANICKFTAYVSPYFVVSNGGSYTKHIYAASQRIASKLGNEDGFGADPRRVEQAGGKKISDFQKDNVGERFKALGYEYSAPEKEKVEKDSTMDSEAEEKLIFFYHPDHLGSTSYVTDADGNISQHVEYIPYGEVFVEERNSQFSTNFLFNAKELDNETGLYYYGARYLDPTGAMWLSVDPMWEKYMGISPYAYCLGNPLKMIDFDGMEPSTVLPYNSNAKRTPNKGYVYGDDAFKCHERGGCTPASIKTLAEKRSLPIYKNTLDQDIKENYGKDIQHEFNKVVSKRDAYIDAGLRGVERIYVRNDEKQAEKSQIKWTDLPALLADKNVDLMGTFEGWGNNKGEFHTMLIESVELKYHRDGTVNVNFSQFKCVDPKNGSLRYESISGLRKLVQFIFVEKPAPENTTPE